MEKAVYEYRQRRQKRLDAKAIEQYKMRRDERLLSRFDDDDDGDKNVGGGKRGGHGNTKIPFGLCQREGIQIDPKWSPKDAWEALAGKGYKAGDVYKELKETGKIGKKSTPKKEPTKLTEAHFPQGMLGSSKKNTMEFAKYINEHCDDADITEFLSLAASLKGRSTSKFKCKKIENVSESKVSSHVYMSGGLADVTVSIPLLTKTKDAKIKAALVRVFAHEWTHYIDLVSREKGHYHYSSGFSELTNAIDSYDGTVGKEVKEAFDKYNTEFETLEKKQSAELASVPRQAAKKAFGEHQPAWVREDGTIDKSKFDWKTDKEDFDKLVKARKTTETEMCNRHQAELRALNDGVASLQGIYASISGGELSASGEVKFGHDRSYFRKARGAKAQEALAEYVALRVTSPELVEMFRRDKPEIAKALDRTIEEIGKRLKG